MGLRQHYQTREYPIWHMDILLQIEAAQQPPAGRSSTGEAQQQSTAAQQCAAGRRTAAVSTSHIPGISAPAPAAAALSIIGQSILLRLYKLFCVVPSCDKTFQPSEGTC